MSYDLLIEFVVSMIGVAFLVGVSWLFGAMKSVRVTCDAAADRLAFDEPDFRVDEWFIGADQKAAAAVSADGGETALVFSIGDGLGTRRFRHGAISVERHGVCLDFQLREPSLKLVRLAAPDERSAEHWVLQLAGARL
jgi:hypothetical protein